MKKNFNFLFFLSVFFLFSTESLSNPFSIKTISHDSTEDIAIIEEENIGTRPQRTKKKKGQIEAFLEQVARELDS